MGRWPRQVPTEVDLDHYDAAVMAVTSTHAADALKNNNVTSAKRMRYDKPSLDESAVYKLQCNAFNNATNGLKHLHLMMALKNSLRVASFDSPKSETAEAVRREVQGTISLTSKVKVGEEESAHSHKINELHSILHHSHSSNTTIGMPVDQHKTPSGSIPPATCPDDAETNCATPMLTKLPTSKPHDDNMLPCAIRATCSSASACSSPSHQMTVSDAAIETALATLGGMATVSFPETLQLVKVAVNANVVLHSRAIYYHRLACVVVYITTSAVQAVATALCLVMVQWHCIYTTCAYAAMPPLDTGQLDTGQLDTGQLDTGQAPVAVATSCTHPAQAACNQDKSYPVPETSQKEEASISKIALSTPSESAEDLLHKAIQNGDIQTVSDLISTSMPVDSQAVLYLAFEEHQWDILEQLLEGYIKAGLLEVSNPHILHTLLLLAVEWEQLDYLPLFCRLQQKYHLQIQWDFINKGHAKTLLSHRTLLLDLSTKYQIPLYEKLLLRSMLPPKVGKAEACMQYAPTLIPEGKCSPEKPPGYPSPCSSAIPYTGESISDPNNITNKHSSSSSGLDSSANCDHPPTEDSFSEKLDQKSSPEGFFIAEFHSEVNHSCHLQPPWREEAYKFCSQQQQKFRVANKRATCKLKSDDINSDLSDCNQMSGSPAATQCITESDINESLDIRSSTVTQKESLLSSIAATTIPPSHCCSEPEESEEVCSLKESLCACFLWTKRMRKKRSKNDSTKPIPTTAHDLFQKPNVLKAEPQTTGISVVNLQCRRFVFYDLEGHDEYCYSSDTMIKRLNSPHIITVGIHTDRAKEIGSSTAKLRGKVSDLIGDIATIRAECGAAPPTDAYQFLPDKRDHEQKRKPQSSPNESYRFFPALVHMNHPTDIWLATSPGQYQCGWRLQFSRENQYFTPQFLHMLLLRLAFRFALAPPRFQQNQASPGSPVLSRKCSIWKSGIQFLDQDGTKTIIEFVEQNQSLLLLMSCSEEKEMTRAKLQFSLVQNVLKDSCTDISTLDCCELELDDLSKTTFLGKFTAVDTNHCHHVLYTLLVTRFQEKIACTVGDIVFAIKEKHDAALPTDAYNALLGSLSDSGHLLYLPNIKKTEEGWVVIDKQALLSESDGTIFATENFQRHHFFPALACVDHSTDARQTVSLGQLHHHLYIQCSKCVMKFLRILVFKLHFLLFNTVTTVPRYTILISELSVSNCLNEMRDNVLHMVVRISGEVENSVLKFLLRFDDSADKLMTEHNKRNHTPLMEAFQQSKLSALEWLVQEFVRSHGMHSLDTALPGVNQLLHHYSSTVVKDFNRDAAIITLLNSLSRCEQRDANNESSIAGITFAQFRMQQTIKDFRAHIVYTSESPDVTQNACGSEISIPPGENPIDRPDGRFRCGEIKDVQVALDASSSELVSTRTCSTPLETFCLPSNKEPRHRQVVLPRSTARHLVQSDAPTSSSHFQTRPVPTSTISSPDHKPMSPEKQQDPYQEEPYQEEPLKPYRNQLKVATDCLHAQDYVRMYQLLTISIPPWIPAQLRLAYKFGLGLGRFKMGKHKEAREHFKDCEMEALNEHQNGDVALCNIYLGDIEFARQSFLPAAKHYSTAIDHYSSENAAQLFKMIIPTTAGLHIKLASALRNASKVVDAVQIYKKAIATAESKKDKLSAHTSLGNLYQSLGENTSALAEYEESIKLSTELKDYVSLGWAHGNMGNAYLGLYQRDKALHQLEKSLELALKYEPTPQAIGRAYNNLGTAYQALNELDKAEEHYDLSLGQAIYGNDTAGQARVYGNIGNLLMLQKKFEKAIPHYTEVLRLSKDRSTVSTAFHNRGCAYYEWAETKKKALFERESKSASSRNGHKQTFTLFGPDFEDCETEHQPPFIADSILKFYQQGSKDLQEVVKFHEETLQNIKGSSSGLSLSVSLFESNSRTFHRLQDCQVNLYRLQDSQVNLYPLQDSQVNLEQQWQKALLVAEQSRSRTLGELLLRKKGWQMRQPLSPPLPLEQIMDVVKAQKVPVVYFSYTGARLLMWALVPKSDSVSMGMCEVPLEDDQFEGKSLDYYLRYSLTEILVEKSFEMYNPFDYKSDFNNPVRDLYEVIGKPLRMLLKNLSCPDSDKQPQKIVIIPDSYTNLLPFTCLLDPETGTFLGDYYSFQIMPSLLAMGIMDQLPPTTVMIPASDQFSLCVVGNPTIPPFMYNGEYWNLGKLPHATKEAEWVAHTLRTKPILHEQATKSAVMMRMMSAKVIHIATHGSAAAGFLAFAGITPHKRSEEAVNSSSVLVYPQDIENQNISPALVVLSSCDSGRGTVKADGIIGMARAFILAGAQAVLTTLWRVPDESAAIFMQFFYQYLVDGRSSSVALQKATLSLRCFSKYSQYIHWSGYQLTGRDVQFVVDSLDSTATKYSLGPSSVFPHLDAVKQLESAFITGPHIPTDVQILRGSPGTKPSEPLKDFIHSFHKHFKGGIFWLNGRKQELIQASIAYIESITGKPFSDIPISEANPALIVLDSIEHLPEFPNHQKVISLLRNPSVHIVIISKYYAPPDSLQKEIDRQLLRGSTVIDIKPLGMIHATQRLVHSVLSEYHLTPYNDDQDVFEKLAEFTSGSPVVGAVTSALLLSSMKCNQTTEETKSPDSVLQEFAGSISLNELDPSSKPASSSLVNHDPLPGTAKTREISADVVRSITSISKAEDPWQTNSYYDLWQAISKLIEECKLIPEEQLLLYCLSMFSCSPIPMSLVTEISSIIARASHQPHLSSSLHSELFEMCLLMRYPLPVVLGPQALELPKQTRATGDLEFVYVPQCLSRAIWKDVMSYPDKVAALSTTYKALHALKETTSDVVERRFLCGLVSLLLETYELNYKLMGKECYQEVYRLFLSLSVTPALSIHVVTPDDSRVDLSVDPTDTIEQIKRRLTREGVDIPPTQQVLKLDGKQLEDEWSLNDCSVSSECILHVEKDPTLPQKTHIQPVVGMKLKSTAHDHSDKLFGVSGLKTREHCQYGKCGLSTNHFVHNGHPNILPDGRHMDDETLDDGLPPSVHTQHIPTQLSDEFSGVAGQRPKDWHPPWKNTTGNSLTPVPPHHSSSSMTPGRYYVPLTSSNVTLVCDTLEEAGFRAADWESLAARLGINPESINAYPMSPATCLHEAIYQWLNKDVFASWEKLTNEVSRVNGYEGRTARILALKRGPQPEPLWKNTTGNSLTPVPPCHSGSSMTPGVTPEPSSCDTQSETSSGTAIGATAVTYKDQRLNGK